MKNQDPDQDFVNHLALNTLDHLVARAPVPSPGLDKRFRCPIDGSTTTQAIQQILDEACTSWVVDGKTVAAQANCPLLQKYRPGQKPRIRFEFLPVSFLLLFFALATAQQWSSSVGLFQSLLLLVFAGGAFLLFWASRQDLPREMAKWEARQEIAHTHWHCHQCGQPFLPKPPSQGYVPPPPAEAEFLGRVQPGPEEPTGAEVENVSPFIPKDSGAENLQNRIP